MTTHSEAIDTLLSNFLVQKKTGVLVHIRDSDQALLRSSIKLVTFSMDVPGASLPMANNAHMTLHGLDSQDMITTFEVNSSVSAQLTMLHADLDV